MAKAPRVPGALTREVVRLLQQKMDDVGWNQAMLGRHAGIPRTTINGIFADNKIVDLEQLERICWSMNWPITELLEEADRNTRYRRAEKSYPATLLPIPERKRLYPRRQVVAEDDGDSMGITRGEPSGPDRL